MNKDYFEKHKKQSLNFTLSFSKTLLLKNIKESRVSQQVMSVQPERMQAVTYQGKSKVRITAVPKPVLASDSEAIVKVHYTTICGSDLHNYCGAIKLRKGTVLGHESVGIVHQAGENCGFSVGDRVAISKWLVCGSCFYCKESRFELCPTAAKPQGQAEYVRVPNAEINLLKIPDGIDLKQAIFLCDVAPTAAYALDMLKPKGPVGVWGCGPVGLCVQKLAIKKDFQIVAVDHIDSRLQVARQIGATTFNFDKEDVVQLIKRLYPDGLYVVDAVGFRYQKSWRSSFERALKLETDSSEGLSDCIECAKAGSTIAVIGDYVGATNHFPIGRIIEKSLILRGGNTPIQKYWNEMLELMKSGFDFSDLITEEMDFSSAVEAYELFDKKQKKSIKILLKMV